MDTSDNLCKERWKIFNNRSRIKKKKKEREKGSYCEQFLDKFFHDY